MDDQVAEIAKRLVGVGGVVGVCLGGSRATGTHRPDSDHDLGLYYRAPLDTAALRELAAELTGEAAEVTEPGGWGPWVDGGAWLTVDGHRVDWIYRDLGRVRRVWQDCRAGRFEIGVQAGHPLGFYSHTYAGELAVGRVLADPDGELRALQREMRSYPEPLRDALVGNARWEVPFTLGVARKGAVRGDAFYVAGCLFRAVGLLVHAQYADARTWVLNEKGALAGVSGGFGDRAQELFAALGSTPDSLAGVLDEAEAWAGDVIAGFA